MCLRLDSGSGLWIRTLVRTLDQDSRSGLWITTVDQDSGLWLWVTFSGPIATLGRDSESRLWIATLDHHFASWLCILTLAWHNPVSLDRESGLLWLWITTLDIAALGRYSRSCLWIAPLDPDSGSRDSGSLLSVEALDRTSGSWLWFKTLGCDSGSRLWIRTLDHSVQLMEEVTVSHQENRSSMTELNLLHVCSIMLQIMKHFI